MHMNTVVQRPYVSSLCSIFLGNTSKKKAHLAERYVHRETYRLISQLRLLRRNGTRHLWWIDLGWPQGAHQATL